MSDFDPVVDAGYSFFDRAKKAVVAGAYATVGTFAAALGALATAGDLSPEKVLAAAASAVALGLGGLGVTYAAPKNRQ